MTVPITIVTGFLGAGKTTLMNHILHGDHGLRVAVLVNDFGSVNIDAALIVGVEGGTVSLSNGCICCTIRDDLLQETAKLLDRPDAPEYIIVETSGVSDPTAVAQTFTHADLRDRIRIDSIVTVVDVEQLPQLKGANAILSVDQIGAADIVIVNKVDLVTPAALEKLKKHYIRVVDSKKRILETTFSQVPLELLLGVGAYDPQRLLEKAPHDVHVHEVDAPVDHHHHDHSLVFSTWTWMDERPFSLKAFQKLIKKLPPAVFRLKGFVYLADHPDQRGVLQVVGTRARFELEDNWGGQQPYSHLVAIGNPAEFDADALKAQFEAALAENAGSGVERLAKSVMVWLRGDSSDN